MDIERVYVSFMVQDNPFVDMWDFFLDFVLDITVSLCEALSKL